MTSIVLPKLGDLRRSLLAESPNEAAAILLAGTVRDGVQERLLVRECHVIARDDCEIQEPLRVVIKPSVIATFLKRARLEGWSLVLAHTHPFADGKVDFSEVDDAGEARLMPSLFARAGGRPHASMVLGTQRQSARVWHECLESPTPVDVIVEPGLNVRYHRPTSDTKPVSEDFDRSVRAFGQDGQAVLSNLTVGIVGLGGLGSIVAEQLAHLGVRKLILIDSDILEKTNLNRVVGSSRQSLGKPKVEVTAQFVRRVRPDLKLELRQGDVVFSENARLLLSADVVFCCTDSQGSRSVLNQLAYQFLLPTIDLGVRIDAPGDSIKSITGRVQMLAPSLPCLVCQNLLDPEQVRRDLLTEEARAADPYIAGASVPIIQPAVISLNGTIASMGVTMMLSAITGLPLAARHQVVMFDRGVTRAVVSQPMEDCVICSRRGTFGRGDLWPMPGRPT